MDKRIKWGIIVLVGAGLTALGIHTFTPYVPESNLALIGQNLPQAIQDKGREIRTFMPKWGIVNERRNQLHEVIRLSGMNLIIDDTGSKC